MNRDIFSVGEAQFMVFVNTFNAGTITHAAMLGIPAELVSDNTAKLNAYTAACHVANSPNAGRIDRENRNEKRNALTKNIRKIKKSYIDADPLDVITSQIMLDFGLPPKSPTRKDVPNPTEIVPFTLEGGNYLQVIVKHPARPPYYNGAVAFYKVGGSVPTTHKELSISKLLTRPHEILTFEDAQLGETLYIALCWENEKGAQGPLSPIQARVIA
ncbi:MAG: hypothetical protein LBJ41_07650 [Treponema sp.]|jgi:hypothetical protein|nr:hypothetical protein [Treponema sp.]